MILLTAWRNHYRLGRPSEFVDTEGWIAIKERLQVRHWLRDTRRFPHFIGALRELFHRDDRRFKSVSDDLQLVDLAAERIYFGEWRLMYRPVMPTPMSEIKEEEIAGPTAEATPPMPSVEPPPPPEPPTLEPGSDAARIAQAMKDAAAAGTPFCEECMKAALRRSAAPPEPEPEAALDPDPDPAPEDKDDERIAEAKKEAARLGVPFCEECMRAQLAAGQEEEEQEPEEEPEPEEEQEEPAGDLADVSGDAEPEKEKTWVGVQMVDMEGKPVSDVAYELKLPDGSTKSGKLDSDGSVKVEDLDPGQCEISFPELDKEAWEPL